MSVGDLEVDLVNGARGARRDGENAGKPMPVCHGPMHMRFPHSMKKAHCKDWTFGVCLTHMQDLRDEIVSHNERHQSCCAAYACAQTRARFDLDQWHVCSSTRP